MREFKKWCPAIRAVRMGGTKEERIHFEREYLPKDHAGKFKWDVLVTSYEGMLKERSKLAKIKWRYLIIDEAHRIKNENSSLSKAVRTIDVDHRLLITGTPLQVRRNRYKVFCIKLLSSPAQDAYRVSQIFLTHFRTWPPAPFRWGGGHIQFSQKHNFRSIMCIF